jgi:hypothetical protein
MEEMSPWVNVLRSPPGLPNANTVSPWRTCEYVASVSAGSVMPSTFSRARSISLVTPTTRAGTTFILPDSAIASVPSALACGNITSMRCAPATTCALVMM